MSPALVGLPRSCQGPWASLRAPCQHHWSLLVSLGSPGIMLLWSLGDTDIAGQHQDPMASPGFLGTSGVLMCHQDAPDVTRVPCHLLSPQALLMSLSITVTPVGSIGISLVPKCHQGPWVSVEPSYVLCHPWGPQAPPECPSVRQGCPQASLVSLAATRVPLALLRSPNAARVSGHWWNPLVPLGSPVTTGGILQVPKHPWCH